MPTYVTNRPEIDRSFQELVRDSLIVLLPAAILAAWLWTGYMVLAQPAFTLPAYLAFAIVAASAAGSFFGLKRSVDAAVATFLLGLILTSTTLILTLPDPSVYYLYLNVVLVTAMLTNTRTTWAVTALLLGLIVLTGVYRALAWPALIMPAFMLLLTALTAWLGSQRLSTALTWALTMSSQAQRNAEEARTHRADLQRAMRSLDLAYARLERANQALIFAQEAAEKAYRFKSDFVANVSHELRTPLNLIIGFSEMMATAPESYGGVKLPREYRGDVIAMYRSARHLLEMINDVLDLSQIEAGRMVVNKELLNLCDVIDEAVAMVRGLAEARGLQVQILLPPAIPPLAIDRTRIRQVLLNLLTNAMRYTEAGWVRVRAELSDGAVWVNVEDSGCGIAPAKLTQAFEAFGRLDESQLHEGSGLGLAVSRKFVELHGGTMGIESEVGRGTKVYFSLPLPDSEPETVRIAPQVRTPLCRREGEPVVLVLHDDPRTLLLLRRHVAGCVFALAATPNEAATHLHAALPNVILADGRWLEQWPGALSRLTNGARIPVLTIPLPSMHQFGQLIGATDFLPKPVTRDDLTKALARLPKPPESALVVDDDPQVVRLIVRMLKAIRPELRVMEAYGGKEGLEVACSQRPDVIFLDLMMPEVSGYSIIEAALQDASLVETAVIVISVRSIEQETAPVAGDIRLQRAEGFSLTELLQLLQSMLTALTRPEAVSPASAAALLEVAAGQPAW
jgi:signal transduction histidine kinase